MRASFKWLFLLSVVSLVAFASWSAYQEGWLHLREPEIEWLGPDFGASESSVLSNDIKADLASLPGTEIWKVDIEGLLNRLQSDRRIRSVQIQRRWPNALRILVEPREAVLLLVTSKGLKPVSVEGQILPGARLLVDLPDLPILVGREFEEKEELRRMAAEMILSFPQTGPLTSEMISEIRYDRTVGFELVLSREGSRIRLGEQEFRARIHRVGRVVSYLESHGLSARVIDARFEKKVVVRLRNAP